MWSPPIDDESLAVRAEVPGSRFDLLDGLADVERVGGDIAGVDDLLRGERGDILHRVVGAQQPRRLAHVRRAEAGPRAIADAAVKGDAHHGDVGAWNILDAGEPGEGGDSRVPRHDAGVGGTDRLFVVGHAVPCLKRGTSTRQRRECFAGNDSRPAPGETGA